MNNDIEAAKKIASDISKLNGKMYFVGGYVRDKLLGIQSKDIDVEVYNIEPDTLKKVLSKYGYVNEFGASFGIFKISGINIDFAMPRKERNLGSGHKDFKIDVDPYMSEYDASKRRDFAMNALMQDVLTDKIIDNFGGIDDINKKVISHIDDKTFVEDSLRALRACEFAARFNFRIADRTILLCKSIDYSNIPKERVFLELEKALLKSDRPSIFFESARKMNLLARFFNPMQKLIGLNQNPKYHPEGDVYTHTMMVLDQAAKLKSKSNYPIALMLSAICHDLGKITTTKVIDSKITSYGHENELYLTDMFLKNLTDNNDLIKSVKILVKNHMRPNSLVDSKTTDKAIRRLIVDCSSKLVNINDVLLLAKADRLGIATPTDHIDDQKIDDWWKLKLEKVNASKPKIKPLVTGDDLIKLGFKPNKKFKEILNYAFSLQINGLNRSQIIQKVTNMNKN